MKTLALSVLLAAPLAVLSLAPVQAQSVAQPAPKTVSAPAGSGVKSTLALLLVTTRMVDGRSVETVAPAPASVTPGSVLVNQATVSNGSAGAITRLHLPIPVPPHTTFAGGVSAGNYTTEYSADGGKTYSAAPTKTVTVQEGGKSVTRVVPVPPAEYTGVRFTVPRLAKGESVTVGFRVKVN